MAEPLKLSMSEAANRGVSALARLAERQQVIMTSHGRDVAIVESPTAYEERLTAIRDAALTIIEEAGHNVNVRYSRYTLSEAYKVLGVSAKEIGGR